MAEMTGSFHEKTQTTSGRRKRLVREGETGREYYESDRMRKLAKSLSDGI
jgi:hypothetical protein